MNRRYVVIAIVPAATIGAWLAATHTGPRCPSPVSICRHHPTNGAIHVRHDSRARTAYGSQDDRAATIVGQLLTPAGRADPYGRYPDLHALGPVARLSETRNAARR